MADIPPLLIQGGMVYDHDGDTDRPARADILIEGARIAAVGPDLRERAATPGDPLAGRIAGNVKILDARDRLIVPGFFNAHYHSHDTLLKGFFETIPTELWGILALPPSFPRRSKRELRARTLIGALECLRGGITTVQDMDRVHPYDEDDIDVVLKAYDDSGIRCVFAPHLTERALLDTTAFWRDTIPQSEQWRLAGPAGPLFASGTDIARTVSDFIRARRDRYPRITFGVGPSSSIRMTRGTLETLADAARRDDFAFYIHVYESRSVVTRGRTELAEFGGSDIRYLEACGVLGPRTSLAHSVWLTQDEIDILARTGTTTALCPLSNMKTRTGVAPFRALIEAGVNVALGCDNCSCSDAQNMFQAMKMFCSLAAVSAPMPGPPHAPDALRAATLGGAKPAGLGGRVGAIKPGHLADLFTVDLADPSFVPFNSAARQLVYTEGGRGVRTVIVDGRIVIDEGRVMTIDEAALRDEIADIMVELSRDAAAVADRIGPIQGAILKAARRAWEHDVGVHRFIGM